MSFQVSAKDYEPRKYINFLTVCGGVSVPDPILDARQGMTRFWKKPNRFSMRPARASVTVKKRNGDVRVYGEGVGENRGVVSRFGVAVRC